MQLEQSFQNTNPNMPPIPLHLKILRCIFTAFNVRTPRLSLPPQPQPILLSLVLSSPALRASFWFSNTPHSLYHEASAWAALLPGALLPISPLSKSPSSSGSQPMASLAPKSGHILLLYVLPAPHTFWSQPVITDESHHDT